MLSLSCLEPAAHCLLPTRGPVGWHIAGESRRRAKETLDVRLTCFVFNNLPAFQRVTIFVFYNIPALLPPVENRPFVFIEIPALFVDFRKILFLVLFLGRTICPPWTSKFFGPLAPAGTPSGADWDIGLALQPSLPRRPWSPRCLQPSILAYLLPPVNRHRVPFGLWEEVGLGAGLALGEPPVVDNPAYCLLLTANCLLGLWPVPRRDVILV